MNRGQVGAAQCLSGAPEMLEAIILAEGRRGTFLLGLLVGRLWPVLEIDLQSPVEVSPGRQGSPRRLKYFKK